MTAKLKSAEYMNGLETVLELQRAHMVALVDVLQEVGRNDLIEGMHDGYVYAMQGLQTMFETFMFTPQEEPDER